MRSEEVEGLCQQLKEKHGSKYKPKQIQTWAHMFHVGTHDTLEEPPNKPFFQGYLICEHYSVINERTINNGR